MRLKKMVQGANGWTEWVQPVMLPKNYILGCCDCGLIHDIQFKVYKKGDKHFVHFRARRNEKMTKQKRRTPQICK